jgi:hypothetical protein
MVRVRVVSTAIVPDTPKTTVVAVPRRRVVRVMT